MDLGKSVAHCPLLALGLLDVGWCTWFPSNINHWPLFFIWGVSHSFITELVIAGTLPGVRYIVMDSMLLSWTSWSLQSFWPKGLLTGKHRGEVGLKQPRSLRLPCRTSLPPFLQSMPRDLVEVSL